MVEHITSDRRFAFTDVVFMPYASRLRMCSVYMISIQVMNC